MLMYIFEIAIRATAKVIWSTMRDNKTKQSSKLKTFENGFRKFILNADALITNKF